MNQEVNEDELLEGQKVAPKVAQKELEDWMKYKKVSPQKRDEQKDSIELLVASMVDGTISINDSKFIVHQLVFPIENASGEVTVTEMKYKPRLSVESINVRLKGVDQSNYSAFIMAYVGALANQNAAILNKMDTEDLRISRAIASFFI